MIKLTQEQLEDLTKEKGLFEIYKLSRRIPLGRFNLWSTCIIFCLLFIQALLFSPELTTQLKLIRDLATIGLTTSLSTLGFLVAGFAIFCSISQPSFMIAMASIQRANTGLSHLKYTLVILVNIFSYYLIFAGGCLLLVLFCYESGAGSAVVRAFGNLLITKHIIASIGFSLLGTGFYFALILLKSFVFNIYHSVMSALRWQAQFGQ